VREGSQRDDGDRGQRDRAEHHDEAMTIGLRAQIAKELGEPPLLRLGRDGAGRLGDPIAFGQPPVDEVGEWRLGRPAIGDTAPALLVARALAKL
jgi:hypothetical protein